MTIDTASVMQIRAQILERNAALASVKEPSAGAGFGDAMAKAVGAVSSAQAEASAAAVAIERGESTDVAAMMLARQKSSLAFQATLQVRNKLLSAYKDIMNMPV